MQGKNNTIMKQMKRRYFVIDNKKSDTAHAIKLMRDADYKSLS